MAHDIEIVDGVARVFVAGKPAWHGLGKVVEQELTSAAAINAAGLDWNVQTSPVFAEGLVVPGYKAVVRDNDKKALGIVGDRYVPIQNSEAFDFMDGIVGEKAAMFHSAGSLCGGRRVWMLAKLPGNIVMSDGDEIEKFLLLSNTHDGSGTLRVLFSNTRVLCANTLNIALRNGSGDGVSIRHTKNATLKVKEAQKLLGIANKYNLEFEQTMRTLLATKFTDSQMKNVLEVILPANDNGDVSTRTQNMRDNVMALWVNGTGINESNRGSGFAAFQAVTEFSDHHKGTRVTSGSEESEQRLQSNWFGSGRTFKQAGFDAIQEQVQMAA